MKSDSHSKTLNNNYFYKYYDNESPYNHIAEKNISREIHHMPIQFDTVAICSIKYINECLME